MWVVRLIVRFALLSLSRRAQSRRHHPQPLAFRYVSFALAIVVLAAPVFAQVSISENPFSTLSAGTYSLSGNTFADSRHNFAVMMKRSEFDKRLLSMQGEDGDTTDQNVVPTKDDAVPQFAAALRKQYFPGESEAQVEDFLRARILEYVRGARNEGFPPFALSTGCAYAAEGLYDAGADLRDLPASTQTGIRGTCALLVNALQRKGLFTTNASRQAWLEYLAIVGGGYPALANRASGDRAKAALAADARATFKLLFNEDITALPPDRFPCIFASKELSCEAILAKRPLFDAFLAKVTS